MAVVRKRTTGGCRLGATALTAEFGPVSARSHTFFSLLFRYSSPFFTLSSTGPSFFYSVA